MIYLHRRLSLDVGENPESDIYVNPGNRCVDLLQGNELSVPDVIVITSRNDLERLIKVLSVIDADEIFPEGETNVT